jgi:hypothetical protein
MIRHFWVYILLAVLFGCETQSILNHPGKNYFLKYYGGDGNQTAVDLIVDTDGTYFILGNSTKAQGDIRKVYLAHVNELGEVIKQITFGEVDMDARDFALTSDGKLVVIANKSNSSSPDILLTRFDLSLNKIDSALLFKGTTSTGYSEYSNSITELSDGGFIVEGWITGGSLNPSEELHLRVTNQLVKSFGTNVWSENQANDTRSAGVKIFQHSQNSYYTFGNTTASSNSTAPDHLNKFWAFNLGANGLPIGGSGANSSDTTFKYPGSFIPKTLTGVTKVPAGGFLLVGYIDYPDSTSIKAAITIGTDTALNFSKNGVFVDRSLGSIGLGKTPYVTAYSSQYSNNNFILANTYLTKSLNSDILLLRVNNALSNDLSNPWTPVKFGGDGEDTAAAVAELPDGHILVLGTMQLGNPPEQFKIVLMKLNSSGELRD